MLFTDDIVLVDESLSEINYKLETWRQVLETKGCRLNRTKTEYIRCNFSNSKNR